MAIAFEGYVMAETPTKVPMKTEQTTGTATP
jgi:hypothetical protein